MSYLTVKEGKPRLKLTIEWTAYVINSHHLQEVVQALQMMKKLDKDGKETPVTFQVEPLKEGEQPAPAEELPL